MQLQPITNTNFGAKNTFLRKAKLTLDSDEKKYFKSLHYEARARLHYIRFKEAEKALDNINDGTTINGSLKIVKTLIKMANEKINSVSDETNAFHSFPVRFFAPDNEQAYPYRYYKTNKL